MKLSTRQCKVLAGMKQYGWQYAVIDEAGTRGPILPIKWSPQVRLGRKRKSDTRGSNRFPSAVQTERIQTPGRLGPSLVSSSAFTSLRHPAPGP